MAKAWEVLSMLCPDAEYTLKGSNYEDISWYKKSAPITKEQYENGFAQYDAWKAEQDADQAQVKTAILDRLGLTADEAKLILG